MSYIKGPYYLWRDDYMHFRAIDGYDDWDLSSWTVDEATGERLKGFEEASGVGLPQSIVDEYVMMRLAEMIYEGLVDDAIERATEHGNFGGQLLCRNTEAIRSALRGLLLDPTGTP